MNHTPHSSQVLTVINNFKKVLPMAKLERHLNMNEPCVIASNHECGTIHCVGGWYAIAKEIHLEYRKCLEYISYTAGADAMAKDFGFDLMSELEYWAMANPHLWGNQAGASMFSYAHAYKDKVKRPNGAKNILHIIDHFTEVYERLLAIEQPQYKNISKELAVLPQDETPDKVIQTVSING